MPYRYHRVVAATGLVAATALLAGCGAVPVSSRTGARPGPTHVRAVSRHAGPPSGTRAEASAVTAQLLSHVVVPAGAQLIQPSPRSPAAAAPFVLTAGSVDMERIFITRLPMAPALAFMLAHPPTGTQSFGTGEQGNPSRPVAETLYYEPAAEPPGVVGAELVIMVMPGPGLTTLIGTYSYASWYPARTAAEHLDAAAIGRVTVTAYGWIVVFRKKPRPFTRTRTFTASAVIARLAGILNGLETTPDEVWNCNTSTMTYQLRFVPRPGHGPEMVVSTGGCPSFYLVTVGGIAQPTLDDGPGAIAVTADKLLGIKTSGN